MFLMAIFWGCGGNSSAGGGSSPPPIQPSDVEDSDGDGDGDGFTVEADCDDLDAASHPGNTEAPCDGRDNDCGGDGDDRSSCDVDFTSADLVIPIPIGISNSVNLVVIPDVTGDGLEDFTADGAGTSGSLGTLYGWSPGAPTPMSVAFRLLDVNNFGGRAHYAGDLSGDGHADLIAKTRATDSVNTIYTGPFAGDIPVDAPQLRLPVNDHLGASLTWDSDGDGLAELLSYWRGYLSWAAPPFDGSGQYSRGAVFPELELEYDAVHLEQLDRIDLDGDGSLEIIVGSPAVPNNWHSEDPQILHVLQGTPQALDGWATEVATFHQSDNHGWAWADFDGDGSMDIAGVGGEKLQVVYGPFGLGGQISLDDASGLTIDGVPSTAITVVPDSDGDGSPEILYACADRLVRMSLREHGHVRDGCTAGHTFVGLMSPLDDDTGVYAKWFGGGDFDGDGLGDVVLTEIVDQGADLGWVPINFRLWFAN